MTDLQTSSEPVASLPCSWSRRLGRQLAETVGWIGLFAALFGGWAWYQTGSLSRIAPYLQGERLLFDPLHVVIDDAKAETVVKRLVRVLNRSSSSITLLVFHHAPRLPANLHLYHAG